MSYKKKLAPIASGALILFSDGAYSEYNVMCIAKALVDLDPEALREEYLALFPEQRRDHGFSEWGFLKWLVVDKSVVSEVSFAEWSLSAWRCSSEMSVDRQEGRLQIAVEAGYTCPEDLGEI